MPKCRITKEKEKQDDTIKRPQENVYFLFLLKANERRCDIESQVQSSLFKNILISQRKTVTNSLSVVVFQVLPS